MAGGVLLPTTDIFETAGVFDGGFCVIVLEVTDDVVLFDTIVPMLALLSSKKVIAPTAKMTIMPIAMPIFFCSFSADSMVVMYYTNFRGCRESGSNGSDNLDGCMGRIDCIGCIYRGG